MNQNIFKKKYIMKEKLSARKIPIFLLLTLCVIAINTSAQQLPSLKIKISVSPMVKDSFLRGGRLILHLKSEIKDRPGISIGVTPANWDPSFAFTIDTKDKDVMSRGLEELNGHKTGKYYCQVSSLTNDYRVSGGQLGAYNAVFGTKGKDGLPTLMFDPVTGKIDQDIAKKWEKYDLKKVLEKNWSTLGPKLQGKIWIWMGDMDALYSNVATRFLQAFLDKTENPKSDATLLFSPMEGHTQEWSDKAVLTLIGERVARMNMP